MNRSPYLVAWAGADGETDHLLRTRGGEIDLGLGGGGGWEVSQVGSNGQGNFLKEVMIQDIEGRPR